MTNPSRFCAICPGVIVIATYHVSTLPTRRSNHDPARDTQQDTRGNVDEQNQECPLGVSILRVVRSCRESRCPSRSPRILTSIRKMWRRGGAASVSPREIPTPRLVESRLPSLLIPLLSPSSRSWLRSSHLTSLRLEISFLRFYFKYFFQLR